MSVELLWNVLEKKEQLHREILLAGEPLEEEVKRLITIKGITPLTALAFLADVGDVKRFKSLRKMNAYLGRVPRVKHSGGKRQEHKSKLLSLEAKAPSICLHGAFYRQAFQEHAACDSLSKERETQGQIILICPVA